MADPQDSIPAEIAETIQVVTYNIHAWIGMDGRCDPERVVGVLRNLKAGVVGLQEVTSPPDATCGFGRDYLEAVTGMRMVAGPTMFREDSDFGNALLSAYPVLAVRRHDISYLRREPRGVLDVDLDIGGSRMRVITTHLGVRAFERRRQVERLLALARQRPNELTVLMGDLNEWLAWRAPVRMLRAWFGRTPALRTFPAGYPLFRLDRIWVHPVNRLQRIAVHDTYLARLASDHLPVVAEVYTSPPPDEEEV